MLQDVFNKNNPGLEQKWLILLDFGNIAFQLNLEGLKLDCELHEQVGKTNHDCG